MYFLVILITKPHSSNFYFFDALTNKDVRLDFKEIAIVTLISVAVGFLFAFFVNYKVLYIIAHKLKISNKFGDSDVWSYIMNSKVSQWVVVRDLDSDLTYEGWIRAFSDSAEKDELFLRDVKVFKSSTSEELYETPGLYLSRDRKTINIEFPRLEFTELRKRIKKQE